MANGLLPPRLQELGDEAGPAGLMRRADAAAGVAVEVLVEQQVVAEVRVGLQLGALAERPAAGRARRAGRASPGGAPVPRPRSLIVR